MAASIRSLGEKTADGIMHTGPVRLAGIQVITDATNNATAILYDNTAASGTKVFEGGCVGANLSAFYDFSSAPVKCENGLYLDITGTGASVIIYTG